MTSVADTAPAGARQSPVRDFREAIAQCEELGELVRVERALEPNLGVPAFLAALGRQPRIPVALLENIEGYPNNRGLGGMFSDLRRIARLIGLREDQPANKLQYLEAIEHPIRPVHVETGPCKENVVTTGIDLEKMFFPLKGAMHVERKYYQPLVITRNPLNGIVNAAIYRCCLQSPTEITANLRWDQHGGLQLSNAKAQGLTFPVAICIGVHPAIYVAGAAKLPYGYCELDFAGGLMGRPVEMVRAQSIDLDVPASAEIVIEGEIRPPYRLGYDGPWPEYLKYLGGEIRPPIVDVTAVTFRDNPINNLFVPGAIPHIMGMGSQAQLLRHLRSLAGEFVVDSYLTPPTVFHHAVVKVRKTEAHHEGLQINVGISALGFSASMIDMVTVVDEDVDIYNPAEVDWAIGTRCNPAEQVHILPQARTHQNNPIAGVREIEGKAITKGKMIIDATIPWNYRQVEKKEDVGYFTRSEWPALDLKEYLRPSDYDRWAQR